MYYGGYGYSAGLGSGYFPAYGAGYSGAAASCYGYDSSLKKEELVERVKERQRQSEGQKQAWYDFCRRKGTSNYDPVRHDEATLQDFLEQTNPSDFLYQDSAGCSDEALVQRVKDWQRRSEGHKQAWYQYCRKNGSDKYDPSRHDAETLRQFLHGTESGSILPDDASWAGWGWQGGGWSAWSDWMQWMAAMKGGYSKGTSPWDVMRAMNTMWAGTGKGGQGTSTLPESADGRPGDWVCSNCKNVNFSRRDECNKCGTSGRGEKRLGMKQGDWICPRCGDLVFASKSFCTMCRTPRPDEVPGGRYSPY